MLAGNLSAIGFSSGEGKDQNLQAQLVEVKRLSSNVEILSAHAFDGCYLLSSVNLNSGLKSIGEYAFAGCANLSAIELPLTLETLDSQALSNCKRLQELTFSYLDSDDSSLTS